MVVPWVMLCTLLKNLPDVFVITDKLLLQYLYQTQLIFHVLQIWVGSDIDIAAIAISDPTHISCTANDFGYDYIFSRYLEALGQEGDTLLAISTSGNSKNVLEACRVAHEKGIKIIGLTGKDGGKLAEICDMEIRAPKSEFADRAQEIHIKIIHALIHYIEENLQ